MNDYFISDIDNDVYVSDFYCDDSDNLVEESSDYLYDVNINDINDNVFEESEQNTIEDSNIEILEKLDTTNNLLVLIFVAFMCTFMIRFISNMFR